MREDVRQICTSAHDLESIKTAVLALAESISAPAEYLPTFANQMDGAKPNIEVTDTGFNYVIMERGKELRRSVTKDPLELLRWSFHDITFEMAIKKELKNRAPGQDFRRLFFQYHLDLLGILDSSWKDLRQKEIS